MKHKLISGHLPPTCLSIPKVRLFDPDTSILDTCGFSTTKTIPSLHFIPIAVPLDSTAFAAYST